MRSFLTLLLFLIALNLEAKSSENIKVTVTDEGVSTSFMLEAEVDDISAVDLVALADDEQESAPTKKMNVRYAEDQNKEPSIEWVINTQYGIAQVINNTSQIPSNDAATEIDLGEGSVESLRIYLSAIVKKKHEIRLLFAPLSYENTFVPDSDILFNGVTFLAGKTTTTGYQFNSYRLSYIYHFEPTGRFNYRIGFTGKIRDAYTLVRQDGTESRFDNIGFVPLLHLGVRINLTEKLYWDNEVEGSWAPQGYAVDFRTSLNYVINDRFELNAGIGFLGGGADTDSVNTFADILFGFVGFKVRF